MTWIIVYLVAAIVCSPFAIGILLACLYHAAQVYERFLPSRRQPWISTVEHAEILQSLRRTSENLAMQWRRDIPEGADRWVAMREVTILFGPDVAASLRTLVSVRQNKSRSASASRMAVRVLDIWAIVLPIRIVNEDLSDYVEDINSRAARGQRTSLFFRTGMAVFWTAVNALSYLRSNWRK